HTCGNGDAPKPRVESPVDAYVVRESPTVRERQRQQLGLLVVARDDLLEHPEALAVHEPVVLVDEEEASIPRHSGLGQLALLELAERETLDRGNRDPGDVSAHLAKPTSTVAYDLGRCLGPDSSTISASAFRISPRSRRTTTSSWPCSGCANGSTPGPEDR